MQKRGQVTIYIILGIVILVVFGLIFFLRNEIVKNDFQSQLARVKVPEQIQPIKNYVDECLEETVMSGARNIALRGGYLDVPFEGVPRSVLNPFSNSLEVGNGEVAYWYYKSANNLDKTQVPTVESMEEDLEEYINENFDFCLKGLDNYWEEGFEISYEEDVSSEVNIEESHIEVKVFAPTDIKKADVGKYFDQHLLDVNVNLGKLYDLALDIFEEENENKFLEHKTIDIMVVYDDIPYSNTEFTCNRLIWQKSEIAKDFKDIINLNLGALRLDGSDYIKTKEDNGYFEVDVHADEDISTNFQYLTNWPFELDVSPSNGDVLMGDAITQANSDIYKYLNLFFCLNNYHFVYDVKYPVLVSLEDDDGFSFQYATMVVEDNNYPGTYPGEIMNYDSTGVLGEEFCGSGVNTVNVMAVDSGDSRLLEDVDISYNCFSSSCYVGRTGSSGELSKKFPACVNGRVLADKEGYYSDSKTLSTNEDSQISLVLEPYYTLDLEFKVADLDTGFVRDLDSKESVIFQFENVNNGYKTMATNEIDEITLVAGEYNVLTYLLRGGDAVKIEGETHVECVDVPRSGLLGIIGLNREECFEVSSEDSEVDQFVSGGSAFEFGLRHDDLMNSNKITLYAMQDFVPTKHSEMLSILNNIPGNNLRGGFVYPELE